MAKKKKEITDIDRKRRLQSIQNLHEKILKNEDVSKFPRLDQVAYILWRYPNTRNSDRTHAIQNFFLQVLELKRNAKKRNPNIINFI